MGFTFRKQLIVEGGSVGGGEKRKEGVLSEYRVLGSALWTQSGRTYTVGPTFIPNSRLAVHFNIYVREAHLGLCWTRPV